MRTLGLFISLAAILGVVAWTRESAGNTLLRRADPLGATGVVTDYQWLSDQAVLHPSYLNTGRAMRWQPPAAAIEITGLSHQLDAQSDRTLDWHLSPDRKRLLWLERAGRNWSVAIAPLDGAPARRWPIDARTLDFSERGGNAAWLADSRHFFMVSYVAPDVIVRIYDSERQSERPAEYRVPFAMPSPPTLGARYTSPVALGSSAANHLFVGWTPIPMGNALPPEMILEMEFSEKQSVMAMHRFELAPGERAGAMVLSPDAKQLALLVSREPRPMAAPTWMELRTCGLEGEGMKTLGRVDTGRPQPDLRWARPPRLRLLRWLPNSRRLSFEYREQLYAIAAQ